jgi:hypothetical protein
VGIIADVKSEEVNMFNLWVFFEFSTRKQLPQIRLAELVASP